MVTALLLASLVASATDQAVSVEWSSVSDATVERCGLDGLQAAILQGLVDEGYAVVRDAPSEGVRLEIAEGEGRFEVRGRRREDVVVEVVEIPSACDATIQVELVDHLVRVARRLFAIEPPPQVMTATVAADPEPIPTPIAPKPWRVSGGVGVDVPGTTMGALRASVRRRVGGLFVGAAAGLSVASAEGLVVFEPSAAVQALYVVVGSPGGFAFLAGVEAGAFGHLFSRDDTGGGGHLDGRVGVVLEGYVPVLGATLSVVPHVRGRPVRHDFGPRTAFTARNFGLEVTLSVSHDFGAP